jgi:uncharacterized protein
MPYRKLENQQDCIDFLRGLLFYGTGGGGSEQWGMDMLQSLLDDGLTIEWIDAEDVADGALTCTAYGTGSISEDIPDTEEQITAVGKKKGLTNKWGNKVMDYAVKELEEYVGKKFDVIVPVELGAGNSPAPLASGIRLGIPVVDGDYGGRAYPEEMQCTLFLNDIPPYPLSIVDWWGDVLILKEAASSAMMERIGKMVSIAAHGGAFIAASMMDGKTMKDTVIPGTLTKSLEVGRAIRLATENGENPVQAAMQASDGWFLFEGIVSKKDWADVDGCMVGTTSIAGDGDFVGKTMDVYFKNENQVTWIDGKPFVCSPDLVTILDRKTGIAYTNTEIDSGHEVAVIGVRCNEQFRSPKGLEWCGPKYYGHDVDYVPIEEILPK